MKRRSKLKIDRCLIDRRGNIRPEIIPNANIMAAAITVEALAADKENRNPSSSKVIADFKSRMSPAISDLQIYALFDFVFGCYQKKTGATVEYLHGFRFS